MFRERLYIFNTPYFAATLVWHRDQKCQPNSQSGGVIIFHCRSRHWCDLLIELCSLYVLFCQSSSSLAYFGEKKNTVIREWARLTCVARDSEDTQCRRTTKIIE